MSCYDLIGMVSVTQRGGKRAGTERKKREIEIMMMMRVMMRGHEPKQRHREKKCEAAPPSSFKLTSIIHSFTRSLSLSQLQPSSISCPASSPSITFNIDAHIVSRVALNIALLTNTNVYRTITNWAASLIRRGLWLLGSFSVTDWLYPEM